MASAMWRVGVVRLSRIFRRFSVLQPPLGHVVAREVNHRINPGERGRIKRCIRLPRNPLRAVVIRWVRLAGDEADDVVTAGGEERHKVRADHPARAGHGDRKSRFVAKQFVPGQVARRDEMPVREHRREPLPYHPAGEQSTRHSERRAVLDHLLQPDDSAPLPARGIIRCVWFQNANGPFSSRS